MSEPKSPIEFSFIVPVYNTGEFLYQCLDSINNQDYDLSKVETILVDDCSTDAHTQEIVKQLAETLSYKNLILKVVFNPTNKWLAETRNVGFRNSTGKYIICLDSDDFIEKDYLKYCSLAFKAYPKASWVYTGVRKFGYKNKIDKAPEFSALNLFKSNYIVMASPVKRELWEELKGQQTIKIDNKVKLFEDWDFWQRALGKKKFGVPVRLPLFNYRQNISSLVSRTEEMGNLTMLLTYRRNWKALFGIRGSQKAYHKANDLNREGPGRLKKIVLSLIIKLTGRSPKNISFSELFYYVFLPKKYLNKKLDTSNRFTKVHKMAGFVKGFKLEIDKDLLPTQQNKNKALCTHFWWHVGGAEKIYLDYMKEIKNLGFSLVDVVMESEGSAKVLKEGFGDVAKEQIGLDQIADGPYPKMLALWELIKKEKPAIILNMSNPLLYILSPLIKEKFPNTVIYDLLHCEEFEDNGWFEAAYYYQNYIDKRIVTSHFWKTVLIQKYQERADKIEIIYNSIDYNKFKTEPKNREAKLKTYGIDPSKKIVGFLGRFHEQKRPDIFVQLAESMQAKTDFHFVMAGDGPELAGLLPRIKSLPNLTYIGPTKTPEKIFTAFDVAIFPSLFEGYPLVGIECAQIGLPIIAADVVGFHEIITNGKAGMLYEVKKPEDDVNSIAHILLENYDELMELGKNGPAFVEAYHNEAFIKQEIQRVFKGE